MAALVYAGASSNVASGLGAASNKFDSFSNLDLRAAPS
jgi:hypothetical protein